MIPKQAFTIAARLIRQLIRDRRTSALIVVVPLVVMTLIGLSFPESGVLDYIAPALLATVEQMPDYLQWLSVILPSRYVVDGLQDIMLAGKSLIDVGFELSVLIGFAVIISILAAITPRRGAAG